MLADAVHASTKILYGKGGERLEALKEGAGPLTKLGIRITKRNN